LDPSSKLAGLSSRLIAMAVSLVGSPSLVMARMQCTREAFYDYCAGRREPAWDELERLVGLLVHEHGKLIAEQRELRAALGSAPPDPAGR
jgi:hypothetical protein